MLPLVVILLAASPNFDADPAIAVTAENARWRSALFWTGRPFDANWAKPCPIVVSRRSLAGSGATSFRFDRGEVFDWSMTVSGSRDAIHYDIIPHEVDHMVRATLARRPMIRWLDEGAAALFESEAEHERLRARAIRFAQSGRRPSFLSASEYPAHADELADLYAVGFSLIEHLIEQGGPGQLLSLQTDPHSLETALHNAYRIDSDKLISNWRRNLLANPKVDCQANGCRFHSPLRHDVGCQNTACKAENRLIIWTASWCGGCRKFWADFHARADFRRAITSRFHIHVADADHYPLQARQHRIEALPTFATARQRVSGYQGHQWLLQQLGVSVQPDEPTVQPVTAEPSEPTAPPKPASTEPTPDDTPTDWKIDPPACPTQTHEKAYRFLGIALTAAEWLGVAGATTGPLGIALAGLSLWRRRRARHSLHSSERPSEVPPESWPYRTVGQAAQRTAEQKSEQRPDHAPFPRELDEARELLRLRQREGRVAALDAIRGMVVDDELDRLAAAGHAECAAQLKRQLDTRVQQIAPITTNANANANDS